MWIASDTPMTGQACIVVEVAADETDHLHRALRLPLELKHPGFARIGTADDAVDTGRATGDVTRQLETIAGAFDFRMTGIGPDAVRITTDQRIAPRDEVPVHRILGSVERILRQRGACGRQTCGCKQTIHAANGLHAHVPRSTPQGDKTAQLPLAHGQEQAHPTPFRKRGSETFCVQFAQLAPQTAHFVL